MKSPRYLCAAVLATAVMLVVGPAGAGNPTDLPGLGYSTTSSGLGGCNYWSATGYGVTENFGSDCLSEFQAKIDAFIAGHPERKLGFQHPAAVAARSSVGAKGYSVSTDYSGPTFTVTGGCEVNSTVGPGGLVALASSLPAAAPCPPPAPPPPTTTAATTSTTPTSTVSPPTSNQPTPTTTTTTSTEPAPPPTTTTPASTGPSIADLERKIAELEQRLAALAGRVDALRQANVAAWDAWVAATEQGLPPHEVALAARSAGMNALYGL